MSRELMKRGVGRYGIARSCSGRSAPVLSPYGVRVGIVVVVDGGRCMGHVRDVERDIIGTVIVVASGLGGDSNARRVPRTKETGRSPSRLVAEANTRTPIRGLRTITEINAFVNTH